ncbi:hypothetical protein F4703DRAFT_1881247 [Phycomyces blakesleeanus]
MIDQMFLNLITQSIFVHSFLLLLLRPSVVESSSYSCWSKASSLFLFVSFSSIAVIFADSFSCYPMCF